MAHAYAPLHSGGIPSPLLGIAPHLWAPRTLADLQAGEDTALRAALRWIKAMASADANAAAVPFRASKVEYWGRHISCRLPNA
jgi:hypothetical protein